MSNAIIKFENLGVETIAAAWKHNRDQWRAELARCDSRELADRYLQARYDAVTRDQKLQQQGERITNLEMLAQSFQTRAGELATLLDAARADVTSLEGQLADRRAESAGLVESVRRLKQERDDARNLARERRLQLVRVMQHAHQLSDVVAPLLVEESAA